MKRATASLVLLAALIGIAAPAWAAAPTPEARQREIDAEVRKLQDEIGEASDQQARLIAELNVSQKLRKQLDVKVAELDTAIAAAEIELAQVNAAVAAAVAAEAAAVEALAEAKRQLEESSAVLREQAVQAYIHFGTRPTVEDLVLNVKDVNDAPRVAAYVQAVAERQADVVDRHRQLQEDTTLLEAKAADAKVAVAKRREDVVRRKGALESARAEQATTRAEVAAEAATEARLLAQVKAKKGEYLRQINQLERESNKIAADLRRRQANEKVTPSGRGVLGFPVANPVVTSAFGHRIHPIYGDRRLHAGIDLRAGTGTPVLAAEDGTVEFAGWMSGYGNTVIIDHGGALATLSAHNSSLTVSVGEKVVRGERVALSGTTGNSTGPHVHFEVRVKGTPVDPMGYL